MNSFSLKPVPPFRLDLTAWSLRRLAINQIDWFDGETYSRVLPLRNGPVEVEVVQTRPMQDPEILVSTAGKADQGEISALITKILGLNIDLSDFYTLAASDERLWSLVQRFRGFKPPRFPAVFEALVNGIACQQISLNVGLTLLSRMAQKYGLVVGDHHAFPRPEDLADATIQDLRAIGLSTRKAEYIMSAARSIVSGELDLEALAALDDASAVTALCNITGVGRWTAQYVALRGLGRLDAFPADDLGAQTRLKELWNLSERPTYDAIHQIIDKWAPYRGLIYFHLFLEVVSRRVDLAPS